MAGKPGRSGGARPGAGRPRSAEGVANIQTDGELEPIEFLLTVMNDNAVDPKLRLRAAIAAAQYRHTKRGDAGKKEERQNAAKAAGAGKFAPGAAPKLVVNNN